MFNRINNHKNPPLYQSLQPPLYPPISYSLSSIKLFNKGFCFWIIYNNDSALVFDERSITLDLHGVDIIIFDL